MPADLASQAQTDAYWMGIALQEAQIAAEAGEVPVGAIVVKNGVVVSRGRNHPIQHYDPTAHAEMAALRSAAQTLENYRLTGCTLYVTLEPCAMCAGAALHARIDRVVFGAAEPKTGAAQSVLNLFSYRQLNHQTTVQGAVLADKCALLLSNFFKQRRQQIKTTSNPLREDALRTAEVRFDALSIAPMTPRYLRDTPALAGLRMHYLDEGPQDTSDVLLCIHSNEGWGVEFFPHIAVWVAQGKRVIVPDLIGFGRSDKPKRLDVHTLLFHRQCLLELLDQLHVQRAEVVVAEPADTAMVPPEALAAPFPDKGYKVALTTFGGGNLDTHSIARDVIRHLANR